VSDLEDPFKVTLFADTKDQEGKKNIDDVEFDPPFPGEQLDIDSNTKIKDLKPFQENPKNLTTDIRDYVHSHDSSATDDLTMAKQWSYMILTKLTDEDRDLDARPKLHIREGDDAEDVARRVDQVFEDRVLERHPAVFGTAPDADEWEIEFDDETKRYIVQKLQSYSLQKTNALLMREAFEVFITDAVKGDEGQFYTRRNLCEGMARTLSPNRDEIMGDLAAGTGGLIGAGIEEVYKKLKKQYIGRGQPARADNELQNYIKSKVFGVDKAHFAVELMETELEAMTETAPNVHRLDSLSYHRWSDDPLPSGRFNVLFANFPYGSGLTKENTDDLEHYDLGSKWKSGEDSGPRELTDVDGIGPSTVEDLRDAGYENIVDVYEADIQALTEIPRIGEKTAQKIKNDISEEDIEKFQQEEEPEEPDLYVNTGDTREEQEVSILFLELYHKMLDENGRTAIVFPETHLVSDDYVAYWLRRNFRVHGVWDLPDEMFQPHTHSKMVVLFLEKTAEDENPREEDYPIFMGTIEKVGHNQRGNSLFKVDRQGEALRDDDGNKIRNDHIPDMAEVTLDFFSKAKDFIRDAEPKHDYFDDIESPPDLEQTDLEDSQVSVVQNQEIEDDRLIPRAYQQQPVEQVRKWAEEHDCELVQLRTLIDEDVVETYSGHGGGKNELYGPDKEIPYINTSRVSKFEVATVGNHVKRIDREVYEEKKEKLEIQPEDIFIVKRGENYIGNVGIVHSSQTPLLSAAESDILRVNTPNDYNLTPAVLLYLLSQDLVGAQLKSKHEYETIIWNVADRYQDVYLPIPQDEDFREEINEAVQKRSEGFAALTESLDDKMGRIEEVEGETEELAPEAREAQTD
jgi:type I restriction-modification system DNA methylase subunit